MDLKKLKIGVLGGGVSTERNISLISAKEAHKALKAEGYDAISIDINSRDTNEVKEIISSSAIELAFIALHGEFGEDGKIQSLLEELAISYTGSKPEASTLAMDKIASKAVFKEQLIPTPDFKVCLDSKEVFENLKFPLVVKPQSSGSSLGLSIVNDESYLFEASTKAFLHSRKIIIEDYILGRELTVGILDDKALAVVEILPNEGYFDFKAKYSVGGSLFIAPAKLEQDLYRKVQEVALAAHRALGCCGFSRVDIRLGQDNIPYVLEVNSIPGLTAHSLLPLSAKVCGIDFNNLILKMVELAYHGKKETQKV